jgi:hypothetical protein
VTATGAGVIMLARAALTGSTGVAEIEMGDSTLTGTASVAGPDAVVLAAGAVAGPDAVVLAAGAVAGPDAVVFGAATGAAPEALVGAGPDTFAWFNVLRFKDAKFFGATFGTTFGTAPEAASPPTLKDTPPSLRFNPLRFKDPKFFGATFGSSSDDDILPISRNESF